NVEHERGQLRVVTLWPQRGSFLKRVGDIHEFLHCLFLSFSNRMPENPAVLRPARPVFNRRYRKRQFLRPPSPRKYTSCLQPDPPHFLTSRPNSRDNSRK